jgi:hypothetical protein
LLGVLLIGLSVWTSPRAMEAPDDGLLEFLGSIDTADKDWRDYLARTDIDKVARRAARTGVPPPDGAPPPSRPAPADPPPAGPVDGQSSPPVASP